MEFETESVQRMEPPLCKGCFLSKYSLEFSKWQLTQTDGELRVLSWKVSQQEVSSLSIGPTGTTGCKRPIDYAQTPMS
jgi:hypothetical protein